MNTLVLIKLGGSVITNKKGHYAIREKNIIRFAREIKSTVKSSNLKLIVGHGAGSFAHVPASIYRTKEGIVNKKSVFGASVTEEAAKMLNAIVVKRFISEKLPVYSFSPGSYLISDTKVYVKSYIEPVQKALEIGIMPIVYGDVVLDRKIGFTIFSTEKILSILAKELKHNYKIKIIYVTDVDGVLAGKGKIIKKINRLNFDKLKKDISGAKGVDVTGGMLHKVEEALDLSGKTGIKTQIISGLKAGRLRKAILGKTVLGTTIG